LKALKLFLDGARQLTCCAANGVKTRLDDLAPKNPKLVDADPKSFVDLNLVQEVEADRALASCMYDDMVKSFTSAGHVDEETQRNDLAIVKLVAEASEVVPNNKAYDFSFARQAETQLNKQGWKP